MKRLAFLLFIAFLWGCEKVDPDVSVKDDTTIDGEVSDTIGTDSLMTDFVLPDTLHVSVYGEKKPQTRTYVGEDGHNVLWQYGDSISFFAGNIHNVMYKYTGKSGVENAELVIDENKPGETGNVLSKSLAVYPYDENISVVTEDGVEKINLTYPVTQTYGVNSFGKNANIMVAAGKNNSDDNLYFRNACGYLVIKLYGNGTDGNPTHIKSLTLSSLNGDVKIAGSAVVVASNDAAPVITMADNASTAVTLDCINDDAGVALGADAEHATEFWFCLPPVSFTGGIKITVTDIYGHTYEKQTSKTVEIVRNEVQPMAAFEIVSKAPTTYKIWYTRSDASEREAVKFYSNATDNPFNANWVVHGWDETEGKFVLILNTPLTTIPAQAFRNTDITTIVLPEGITTIEKEAFRNTPLTEITIPGSMNLIEQDAFYDCDDLTSVTLLPSPTKTPLKIGYTVSTLGAKYGPFFYTKLNTINVNRETILVNSDNNAFTPTQWDEGIFAVEDYEDVNSVSVAIGPQVETISDYMFNRLNIETLTIPGTVKTIGNCVFDGCSKLTSLVYEPSPTGESLTHGYNDDSYDEGPFIDSPLTSVNLNREIVYTYPESALNEANEGLFGGKGNLTSITIGDQVKTLPGYMLASTGITSIDLNNVSTIGKGAMMGTKCTSIELPASVTSIGDYAFADSQIQTIDLNQVKTIGNGALRGAKFTSITIPGTVTKIGDDVFNGCTSLSSVTFEGSTAQLTVGYNTDGADEGLFVDAPLTTVNLNRDITYTFPTSSLDDPTEGLFGNKSSLVNITLGDNAKTLTGYMFANAGIESINLNKVTTIGKGALQGIKKITELTIPASVTSIEDFAFKDWTSLANLTFASGSSDLTIGFQPGTAQYGPFYQSPLAKIVVNRSLVLTSAYASACDSSNEGLFSTSSGNLTSTISLGGQVGKIPEYMFGSLPLTEITIPATVTEISNDAFTDCKKLRSVTFEASAATLKVGYNTAGDNDGLFVDSPLETVVLNREINYTFPDPDTAYEGLFGVKPTLKNITIGDNVKTLSGYMFAGAGVTSIDLNKVTTIGNGALSGIKFTDITIPATVTEIGNDVFNGCTSLKSVIFEGSTAQLTVGFNTDGEDEGLFVDAPLTTVNLNRDINYTFPTNSLDTPIEGLFGNKPSLVNITLGDNAKTVSGYMFANAGITSINLNKVTSIGKGALEGVSNITELEIPASVTSIGDFAFKNCTSLANLTFATGSSDLTIGFQPGTAQYGPFYQSPLTSIVVNRSLVLTDAYATACDQYDEGIFSTNPELGSRNTTISLGGQVGKIPEFMFSSLPLTEITIPATVTEISNDAFTNCKNLSVVTFEEGNQPLTIGYNTVDTDESPFVDAPLTKVTLKRPINYTFPNPDTAIEGLFGGKTNLAEVELGQYINNISDYMFANTGIQTLSLPITNVETIGNGAFSGSKLVQITIPYYVRSIGVNAFVNCDYLAEVYIQGTTTALTVGYQNTGGADWGPFYDSPLSKIVLGREINYVNGNGQPFTPVEASDGFFANEESGKINNVEVTISDNVKTISNYMFTGIKMNSLSIPNSVTKIGKHAFDGCSTLSSVNIPGGVTEIDEYTFSGCSSLAGLTIPANVTTIRDYAFYGCSSLSDLTIASATTPLTFGYQPSSTDDRGPFYQSPLSSIKLDRPIAMTADYNTNCDQWDEGIFSNSSYNADGDWVTDLVLGPNVKTILKYMFAGTRVQQLHIPETIEEIGVNVIEKNEKLNAIIFYDENERPNVENGAFGTESNDYINNTVFPPGKGQYYVFVPYRLGRLGSYRGELYYTIDDLMYDTYWDVLHAIMVDDQPTNDYSQPHRNTESWYLNVTGYDWYKERYYDYITITPPTF